MKKHLLFAVLPVSAIFLAGCSTTTTPPPVSEPVSASAPTPAIQPTLFGNMQKLSAGILDAGGLAVIGTGESKSLDLALNMAKKNGRLELEQMLTGKVAALEKAFTAETGMSSDALILCGFNNTVRIIAKQQIAGSVAQTLKYETTGDTFTAYAVMVLDPKAITEQLAKEKDLFDRLQTTKAFGELDKEVKAYEAFKAAQK